MKDYAGMSDQEINMHVASIIYPESTVIKSKARPPCACITGHIPSYWVDYCNNPADAWPIIVGKQISLISRCANDEWKAQLHLGRDDIFDSYASCWDKNPLRAAMIVFLMMKESENDSQS